MQVLCGCAELQAPAAGALWGQLLAALLRMLEDSGGDGAAADRDGDGAEGDDEYASLACRLWFGIPAKCCAGHAAGLL